MFKRLIYDDWTVIIPVVAFIVAAGIFAYFFCQALRMKSTKVDRFASLPFQEEHPTRHETSRE